MWLLGYKESQALNWSCFLNWCCKSLKWNWYSFVLQPHTRKLYRLLFRYCYCSQSKPWAWTCDCICMECVSIQPGLTSETEPRPKRTCWPSDKALAGCGTDCRLSSYRKGGEMWLMRTKRGGALWSQQRSNIIISTTPPLYSQSHLHTHYLWNSCVYTLLWGPPIAGQTIWTESQCSVQRKYPTPGPADVKIQHINIFKLKLTIYFTLNLFVFIQTTNNYFLQAVG